MCKLCVDLFCRGYIGRRNGRLGVTQGSMRIFLPEVRTGGSDLSGYSYIGFQTSVSFERRYIGLRDILRTFYVRVGYFLGLS